MKKISVRINRSNGTINYTFYNDLVHKMNESETRAEEKLSTAKSDENADTVDENLPNNKVLNGLRDEHSSNKSDQKNDLNSSEEKNKKKSNYKDMLEKMAIICPVFVLGMTCLRAAVFSWYYNVPFSVIASFSAVYDISMVALLLAFFAYLIYIPYGLMKEIDFSKKVEKYRVFLHVLFIIGYSIIDTVFLLIFYHCLSENQVIVYRFLKWFFSGLTLTSVIILGTSLYTIAMLVCRLLVYHKTKKNIKEKVSMRVLFEHKWFQFISILLLIVIVLCIAIPWIGRFYGIILPFGTKKYEVVEVDNMLYAVISETSDGKIIEKCIEIRYEDGTKNLIIYTDNYQYISEDNNNDLVFSMKEYAEVKVESEDTRLLIQTVRGIYQGLSYKP